eukprot:4637508-Pyramimonas_sp.AAC.1
MILAEKECTRPSDDKFQPPSPTDQQALRHAAASRHAPRLLLHVLGHAIRELLVEGAQRLHLRPGLGRRSVGGRD